jgi:hypothetical protein
MRFGGNWKWPDGTERDIALIELRADQLHRAIDESTHRFDKPVLQIRELLGLLINPDRARFELISDASLRAAVRYGHDRHTVRAVLYKLQEGRLTAYEDDKPRDRDFWINKTGRDLLTAAHFRVWAEAVFAIWPELRNVPATGTQSEAALEPREALGSAAEIGKMESIRKASLSEPAEAEHGRAKTPAPDKASYSEIKKAVRDAGHKLMGEGHPITERPLLAETKEALRGKQVPRGQFRVAWNEIFGRPGRRSGRPKSLK